MSKGSPILPTRIPRDLLDEIDVTIQRRNEWSMEEPLTRSSFIIKAIREKIAKMARSRRRSPRRQSAAAERASTIQSRSGIHGREEGAAAELVEAQGAKVALVALVEDQGAKVALVEDQAAAVGQVEDQYAAKVRRQEDQQVLNAAQVACLWQLEEDTAYDRPWAETTDEQQKAFNLTLRRSPSHL